MLLFRFSELRLEFRLSEVPDLLFKGLASDSGSESTTELTDSSPEAPDPSSAASAAGAFRLLLSLVILLLSPEPFSDPLSSSSEISDSEDSSSLFDLNLLGLDTELVEISDFEF